MNWLFDSTDVCMYQKSSYTSKYESLLVHLDLYFVVKMYLQNGNLVTN